ncbi:hypothetical protein D3C75_356770 [compost metagenome]
MLGHGLLIEQLQLFRFIGHPDEVPGPALLRNQIAFRPIVIFKQLGQRLIHLEHVTVHLYKLDALINIINNIAVQPAAVLDFLIHEQALDGQSHPVHHALDLVNLFVTEGMTDPCPAEYSKHFVLGIDNC